MVDAGWAACAHVHGSVLSRRTSDGAHARIGGAQRGSGSDSAIQGETAKTARLGETVGRWDSGHGGGQCWCLSSGTGPGLYLDTIDGRTRSPRCIAQCKYGSLPKSCTVYTAGRIGRLLSLALQGGQEPGRQGSTPATSLAGGGASSPVAGPADAVCPWARTRAGEVAQLSGLPWLVQCCARGLCAGPAAPFSPCCRWAGCPWPDVHVGVCC